nr:type II toxin-antitoxin system RelE/ParE family toxin [Candidatus Sigynarchaeota archaeon]
MKAAVILQDAEKEMTEAVQFYEAQAKGLGVEFLSEVERAIQSIRETPETWPILEGDLRRRLLRRFPFGILYRIEADKILIIAVAHLRRKPGYWKERL